MKKVNLSILIILITTCVVVASSKPNVVLFYADDFGWGDLRHHNKKPEHFRYTPNMDRMFAQGIELKNYMTHPVCSPSRAGLLTGKHYANVGAGPLTGGTLPIDIRNIAKDFQSAGYKTGAFGKWHNSYPNFPEEGNGRIADYNKEGKFNELHNQKTLNLENNIFENHKDWKWSDGVNAYGFDRWVGYYNGGGDFFDRYVDIHHDIDWWHDRSYRGDEKGYTTDLITKYANEFIEQNKNQPFFCYIPHEAIHNPLQLKRSDLKEFCEKLDSELNIKGQWEFISNVVSPKTGRRLGDVEEIRCDTGKEFDLQKIDSDTKQFTHLLNAAFIYTMDKSIGKVIEKVLEIGKFNETIFVFASDNGGTKRSVNEPFKGGKHTLWEGGIHVPAAIWWPETFDHQISSYAGKDNAYEGLIAYYDLYPTLMAMTGQTCQAKNLDGKSLWNNLIQKTEGRPNALQDTIKWMWTNEGMIRSNRWKLFYSEDIKTTRLYDIQSDIGEDNNTAATNPEVAKTLIEQYRNWIKDNNYAMSWMTIDSANISHPDPAPEGQVLEITATQTKPVKRPSRDGVFVRFSDGTDWSKENDSYIHTGDRVEFDIFVCEDSDAVQGCFYSPGLGWNPFYNSGNGLNQDGILLYNLELPKGVWTRQVVGIGNLCPGTIKVNYIALLNKKPGNYHYYMDNIIIRKRDGSIRSVIWQSEKHFAPIIYSYKNKRYRSIQEANKNKEFPFSDIQLKAIALN